MFQPEYAILPQVRTTFITGNIGKGLEKLLKGFLVFTTYKGIIHDPWWNDLLGRMVRGPVFSLGGPEKGRVLDF